MDSPTADDRAISPPPYAAWTSFDALLQRASREDVPPRVDKGLLQSWGIAAGNESGMLTTLRALGLIDRSGRPTADFRALRLSAPRRREALQRAFLRAYPGLSYDLEPPISDDELHDYFVDERGLTGQMVQKATRFYHHLAHATRPAAASDERSAPTTRRASGESVRNAPTFSVEPSIGPETRVPPLTVDPPSSVDEEAADDPVVVPPEAELFPEAPAREPLERRFSGELSAPGVISGGDRAAVPSLTLNLSVAVPLNASDAEIEALFSRVKRAWNRVFGEGAGTRHDDP